MNTAQGVAARRHAIIVILFAALMATALTTGGCGDQMARMEQNQVRLQAMIMANARQLSTVSSQVDRSQTLTDESFAKVDQDTQTINTQVQTVQREQAQLHAALLDGNHEINRKIAQLDRNQTHLKDGVAQVGNIAQKTNAAVGAVARDQATLHRMVQNNKQELDGTLTVVAKNQQATHTGIGQLRQADRSLAGKQDALQRLAQNNNRQLVDRLVAMDSKQQELDADLGNLHSLTQTVGADVTTLGTQQTALHRTFNTNTTTLADKLTLLEQHQLDFQTIIDRVANTTSHTADGVTALAAGQATIQQTQDAQHVALNSTLNTITQNQQGLQASLGTLDQKADQATGHLTRLSDRQNALQETMQANDTATVSNLTNLANNQQTLRDDIATLTDKAAATAGQVASVATELTSVHDAVKTGNADLTNRTIALATGQDNLGSSIHQVHSVATQTATDQAALGQALQDQHQSTQDHVAKLADRQHSVQDRVDTLMATSSQLALNTVTMVNRQADFEQDVRSDLASLNAGADQLITGQSSLAQAVQKTDTSLAGQIAGLATDQRTLQSDLENLTSNTTQIASNVNGLADGQKRLQQAVDMGVTDLSQNTAQLSTALQTVDERQKSMGQTLTAHNDAVSTRMAHLTEGQKNLHGSLDTLTATTTQVALDVVTLDDNQIKIKKAVQTNGQTIATGLTEIASDQEEIQSGLDMLTATTTQMALDVITLDGNQTNIQKTLQANGQGIAASRTETAERQGQIQSGLDILSSTTTQMALDVITLDGNQATIQKTLQANGQGIAANRTETAERQGQIQSGLENLTATTTQMALDVITLDGNQATIQRAVQTNGQNVAAGLGQVAERQGQMLGGLDTLTGTTTQLALDVIAIDDNQAKQGEALQANQQELASTLTAVAENQQQTRTSLDAIAATTGQVAKDVITLDDNQAKLQEAVQANRQELTTKLTEIAQGQQQWLARFDAAQAQVETMTAGITALEQRVSSLQSTLQTSLQDISTLLDTESQQRVRFEESVQQDMQGVADTISQLREVQAGLAEHIQRMQDSSQSQTGDILSALKQLQQKADVELSAAEAQPASSKASLQEITLP